MAGQYALRWRLWLGLAGRPTRLLRSRQITMGRCASKFYRRSLIKSAVYVDLMESARHEAGDVMIPIQVRCRGRRSYPWRNRSTAGRADSAARRIPRLLSTSPSASPLRICMRPGFFMPEHRRKSQRALSMWIFEREVCSPTGAQKTFVFANTPGGTPRHPTRRLSNSSPDCCSRRAVRFLCFSASDTNMASITANWVMRAASGAWKYLISLGVA